MNSTKVIEALNNGATIVSKAGECRLHRVAGDRGVKINWDTYWAVCKRVTLVEQKDEAGNVTKQVAA